jgi:hypothetical protein
MQICALWPNVIRLLLGLGYPGAANPNSRVSYDTKGFWEMWAGGREWWKEH